MVTVERTLLEGLNVRDVVVRVHVVQEPAVPLSAREGGREGGRGGKECFSGASGESGTMRGDI